MAIDISELTVIMVNINNILETPIVKFIFEYNKKILDGAQIFIINEENYKNIIKSKHDNLAFDSKLFPFISDESRLYFNTMFKYPLYLDCDMILTKEFINRILSNPNENILYSYTTAVSYLPNQNDIDLIKLRNFYKSKDWKYNEEFSFLSDGEILRQLRIREKCEIHLTHTKVSWIGLKINTLKPKKIIFSKSLKNIEKDEFLICFGGEPSYQDTLDSNFSYFYDCGLNDNALYDLCICIAKSYNLDYSIDYQPS